MSDKIPTFPLSLAKIKNAPEGYFDSLSVIIAIINDFNKPHYDKSPTLRKRLYSAIYELLKSEEIKTRLTPLVPGLLKNGSDIIKSKTKPAKQLERIFGEEWVYHIQSLSRITSVEEFISLFTVFMQHPIMKSEPLISLNYLKEFMKFERLSDENLVKLFIEHPILFVHYYQHYDIVHKKRILTAAEGLIKEEKFHDLLMTAYYELSFTDFPIKYLKKILITVIDKETLEKRTNVV